MKYFSKKRFTMRQVVGLLTIVFLGIAMIAYAAVTIPNTFSSGTTISSSQVNANFTAVANEINKISYYRYGDGTSGWNPDGAVTAFVVSNPNVNETSIVLISVDLPSGVTRTVCAVDASFAGTFDILCTAAPANNSALSFVVINP